MIPLSVLVAVAAGAVAAVSGFGIGSFVTPLLLTWLDPATAVAVVAGPHALATLLRLLGLRREVHGPTFRQFGIASAAGGLVGALIQSRIDSPWLTRVLAVLLFLAGSSELIGRRLPLPTGAPWRLAGGALSGMFGGMVGNQGGIRAAALLGFDLTARQLVATATASAILVDAARLPVYLWSSGNHMAEQLPLISALTAGVLLGTALGVPLLSRIPLHLYRRVLGGLLIGLAIWLARNSLV
jgi:uncharacterized protein